MNTIVSSLEEFLNDRHVKERQRIIHKLIEDNDKIEASDRTSGKYNPFVTLVVGTATYTMCEVNRYGVEATFDNENVERMLGVENYSVVGVTIVEPVVKNSEHVIENTHSVIELVAQGCIQQTNVVDFIFEIGSSGTCLHGVYSPTNPIHSGINNCLNLNQGFNVFIGAFHIQYSNPPDPHTLPLLTTHSNFAKPTSIPCTPFELYDVFNPHPTITIDSPHIQQFGKPTPINTPWKDITLKHIQPKLALEPESPTYLEDGTLILP